VVKLVTECRIKPRDTTHKIIDYINCSQRVPSIIAQCQNHTVTPAPTVSHSRRLSLISLNIECEVTSASPCVLYATLYSFQTMEEKTKYSELTLTRMKSGHPTFQHTILLPALCETSHNMLAVCL